MRFIADIRRIILCTLVTFIAATVFAGDETQNVQPAKRTETLKAEQSAWLKTVEEGQRHALREGKPVLVWVAAAWCPVCKKLAVEIDRPQVKAELARWAVVYIDVDQAEAEAAKLAVAKVPTLRVLKADGHRVASREGDETLDGLEEWLKANYDEAVKLPDEVLAAAGPPNAGDAAELVRRFDDRSPVVREAAIRRLMHHPGTAGEAVVDVFIEGSLAGRLAALELLQQWKAPIDGLDPWQPESLTPDRVAKLEAWRKESATTVVETPTELTAEQRAAAVDEIVRMLKGSDAEAGAIRERLARLGSALLPTVVEQLKAAAADRDRERLAALRYRLVASDSLALRWPGGLVRLAATETAKRKEAAEELASRATADDQSLLRELFSDPDPLVREICLRGLQNIGAEAQGALVELLSDPEPNVRAAVLKQLEEKPIKGMVGKIAEYVKTEKDADLVVHAARFLQQADEPPAVRSLIGLLKHESWQVRAEAAGALGGRSRNHTWVGGDSNELNEDEKLQADAYVALIELLDDSDNYVVSKAVEGLSQADMVVAVEPLVKAAQSHPELAKNIIEILAAGQKMREKALPHLRDFARHENPAIRAAALRGLAQSGALDDEELQEAVAGGLSDGDSDVRTAAAEALFKIFEKGRLAAESGTPNRRRARLSPVPTATPFEAEPLLQPPTSFFGGVARVLQGIANEAAPAAGPIVPLPGAQQPPTDSVGPAGPPLPPTLVPGPPLVAPATPPSVARVDEPPRVELLLEEEKTEGEPVDVSPGQEIVPPVLPGTVPLPSAPAPTAEGITPPARFPVAPSAEEINPPARSRVIEGVAPSTGPIELGASSGSGYYETTPGLPSYSSVRTGPSAKGMDEWLEKYYQGDPRPAWTNELVEPLTKMLAGESLAERVAAAKALVPLGKADLALPVLLEGAQTKPEFFGEAAGALPWLVREKRLALFNDLRSIDGREGQIGLLFEGISQAHDARDEELFWTVLAEETTPNVAMYVYGSLQQYYSISRNTIHYSNSRSDEKHGDPETVKKLSARIDAGPELQRLVALALLAGVDNEEAAKTAERLMNDATLAEDLRRDAFQVMLLTQLEMTKRVEAAVEALNQSDPTRSRIALKYLAGGVNSLGMLRERMYLAMTIVNEQPESRGNGQPIIPRAPKGLKLDDVRPLMDDSDSEIAAYAAYLMALMNDASGMETLVDYWRETGRQNSSIGRFVYRAAAVLDDPKYVPVLREVYGQMQDYQVSEFYWTIRIMSGPEILKFRKEIREKHGMSQLQ